MTRRAQRIALNVRAARADAGLTQQELAVAAGVAVRTVARLESGETKNPREDEFQRIAVALGTTSDALMGIEDEATDAASKSDDAQAWSDVQRAIAASTGSKTFSAGLVGVVTNWDRVRPSSQRMLEAAVLAALESAEADDDIGREASPD